MAANQNRAAGAGKSGPAPSATPNYDAARRRFQQHVTISRRARRQSLLLTALGAMSVVTLLVSGSAWIVTGYLSSALARLDAGTSGTPSSGSVNILVVGVDTRGGLTHRQQASLGVGNSVGTNTDTMMLVHMPGDHQSVQVVSLPRDSWVTIPGYGMNKINAALALGGPPLMVSTVEQATGLTVNDYVEINFVGFVRVIDALGGVNICLPFAVNDSYTGLHLPAGHHHVDGVTALEFARDRHSFVTSDLARIDDQQQLVSSAFVQASTAGALTDPVRLQQVVSAVTSAVTVDRGFNVTQLADEMRGIQPADVSFTTVPIATPDYQTPTGESAVLWNQTAATALFQQLKTDSGLTRPHRDRQPGPGRSTGLGQPTGGSQQAPLTGGHTAAQAACA